MVLKLLSHVWLFVTHGLQHASLHYLMEFAQVHVHRVGDAILL